MDKDKAGPKDKGEIFSILLWLWIAESITYTQVIYFETLWDKTQKLKLLSSFKAKETKIYHAFSQKFSS